MNPINITDLSLYTEFETSKREYIDNLLIACTYTKDFMAVHLLNEVKPFLIAKIYRVIFDRFSEPEIVMVDSKSVTYRFKAGEIKQIITIDS